MNAKKQAVLDSSEGVPIIELSGDFSEAVGEDLRAAYQEACESQPQNIIIEFDEDGHVYSSGIAVLVGLIGEAEGKGQKIYATGLSAHAAEVFELTALTKYIQILPSKQEALAAVMRACHYEEREAKEGNRRK